MKDPEILMPHYASYGTFAQPTGRLRWLQTANGPRLQQEWAARWMNELGEGELTEWHDVPTVDATP